MLLQKNILRNQKVLPINLLVFIFVAVLSFYKVRYSLYPFRERSVRWAAARDGAIRGALHSAAMPGARVQASAFGAAAACRASRVRPGEGLHATPIERRRPGRKLTAGLCRGASRILQMYE